MNCQIHILFLRNKNSLWKNTLFLQPPYVRIDVTLKPRNLSALMIYKGPPFLWQMQIQTTKYGLYDVTQINEKEFILILHLFTALDMNFQTILMPKVISNLLSESLLIARILENEKITNWTNNVGPKLTSRIIMVHHGKQFPIRFWKKYIWKNCQCDKKRWAKQLFYMNIFDFVSLIWWILEMFEV